MKSHFLWIVVLCIIILLLFAYGLRPPTNRQTPTPTNTISPPAATNTIAPTLTNTNLPAATITLALTYTPDPTNTATLIPSKTPTSTSTSASPSVFQPPTSNPPTATRIHPTRTNIPPSDTPLPPTQTPSPTATNALLLSFDSLPSSQGWIYMNGESGISETDVFSVSSSQLHMDTIGKGFYGFAYKLYTPIDHQLPFTLIVRARVTAYGEQTNENPFGFDISVNIGSEQFELGISPGRIIGGNDTESLPSTIDITQFHNYRIEGQAGRNFFDVFVDDLWLGTCAVTPGNTQQDALYFGDGTGGANARVDIESYYFTQ